MATALPLPKYHQIYLVLREQLREGRFARGLPSEMLLSREFRAGRVTVRRALEQLAGEGLIMRRAGRGTYPAPTIGMEGEAFERGGAREAVTGISGLLENIVTTSLRTVVKVIEVRTIHASHDVADALQLPFGSRVQKAVRRRSTTQGPVSYITTYVPEELARNFGRRDLQRKPILRLIEEAGVRMGRARQIVSARQADAAVARELEVAVGTALLAVRRLVFDVEDRPVQWLDGLYRPDRYEYQMDVSQVGSVDTRISVKEHLSE